MTNKLEEIFETLTCQQINNIKTAIGNIYDARDVFNEVNNTLKRQHHWKYQGDVESICYQLNLLCTESYIAVLHSYIKEDNNG